VVVVAFISDRHNNKSVLPRESAAPYLPRPSRDHDTVYLPKMSKTEEDLYAVAGIIVVYNVETAFYLSMT
jgi:hypothetical protein